MTLVNNTDLQGLHMFHIVERKLLEIYSNKRIFMRKI